MNAERTAAYAAHHARLAKRPHRIPRAQPPKLIEADYAASLVAMVHEWRSMAQPLIDDYNRRTDDTRRSRNHLQRVRGVVTSTVKRTPIVAERTARRVIDHSKRQVARQTKAALGIDVPALVTGLDKRIEGFIQQNTAAIQRLGNATADQIEATLARAFAEGWSDDQVADDLMKRFGIAEKQARFIARDQVLRLYSQVTRMQHRELGVKAFRWNTRQDGRVRKSHKVKHGKIFPYEGSRAPSFLPGDEIGCRCWEEPAMEEIKAAARALAGKGRSRG